MVAEAVLPSMLKAASATERSSHNLLVLFCLCKCLLIDTVNKVVKLSQVKTSPAKKIKKGGELIQISCSVLRL